jgi:hypothetical protein
MMAKVSGRSLAEHLSRVTKAHAATHAEQTAEAAAWLTAVRDVQNATPESEGADHADDQPTP